MYKIKEFAKLTNTSVVTLRYYDEIDLFKPEYVDYYTGYRYYEDNQVYTINEINKLKEIDLSLQEINNYLQTKDDKILINKLKGYEDKMEKIKDILNNKESNNYKVLEGDYNKFIELRGLLSKKSAMALELKDNNAKYYYILKDNEIVDDFVIYNENNWITLNKNEYKNKELVNEIFNTIKKDYEYISIKLPKEEKELIKYLKGTYTVSTKEEEQCGYFYINLNIKL